MTSRAAQLGRSALRLRVLRAFESIQNGLGNTASPEKVLSRSRVRPPSLRLFGLLAHGVGRGINEIGIRVSLGARRGRAARRVLGDVLEMVVTTTICSGEH